MTKLKKRSVEGLELLEFTGDPAKGAVLCLHGYGANNWDLAGLVEVMGEGPTWLFPNGPLEIVFPSGNRGCAWFEIHFDRLQAARAQDAQKQIELAFPANIDSAREQMERLIDGLQIDPAKLFIGGFSQGAVLAVDVALHLPFSLAGLFVFSGALVFKNRWQQGGARHTSMPFFQSHGKYDPLLDITSARSLEKLLLEAGLRGSLIEFEGGHEIPNLILEKFKKFLIQNIPL